MKITRNYYNLSLDAHFDLGMAGDPNDPESVSDMQDAFIGAAAQLAENLAIAIDVTCVHDGYEGAQSHDCDHDHEAIDLWQAIYDAIWFDKQEQAWFYDPGKVTRDFLFEPDPEQYARE